jgi:hypothetical protein
MSKTTSAYTSQVHFNTIKKDYHDKKIPYVIVEGDSDHKLFAQRIDDTKVKLKSVAGKDNVNSIFNTYRDEDCILCCVQDLDTDYITNDLNNHHKLIYNCYPLSNDYYNDIEIYLINTRSLNILLTEYLPVDYVTKEYVNNLRIQLEQSSRIYDSFFHAYNLLKYGKVSNKSFKNIIEPTDSFYFDANDIEVNKLWIEDDKLKHRILINLKLTTNEYMQLVQKADSLIRDWQKPWSLSRGHTVTTMLAKYLCFKTPKNNISAKNVESALRMAADIEDLKQLPIAKIVPFK